MGRVMRIETAADVAATVDAPRPREAAGWRRGRPVEDPDKTKRWGWVTAKPSEYLVHVRRGKVRARSSGQGATCFKRPWDAVAVVPTSLQRLHFEADQVTIEKVGVAVQGLAVYRIADPLLAFRVLNFSYPERAQEKLEETLTGMFVGASRRIIATLSVEDCLQKRKSALAQELLREVAPVVGGDGHPDDVARAGWGVVIDTIEIQEVRVLSDTLFAAMQAPYRSALEHRARTARADAERAIATQQAECNRGIEEARIAVEMAVQEKRRQLVSAEAQARREEALRALAIDHEIELAQHRTRREQQMQAKADQRDIQQAGLEAAASVRQREIEAARAEAQLEHERAVEQMHLAAAQAEEQLQVAKVLAAADATQHQRQLAAWRIEHQRRIEAAALQRQEGESAAAVALAQAEAERVRAAARAQIVTAERLADVAAAVGGHVGEMRVTQIGTDSVFGGITQAVAAVLELVRAPH